MLLLAVAAAGPACAYLADERDTSSVQGSGAAAGKEAYLGAAGDESRGGDASGGEATGGLAGGGGNAGQTIGGVQSSGGAAGGNPGNAGAPAVGGAGDNSPLCPFDSCDAVCTNVLTDEAHCGGCDNACNDTQLCRNGNCLCPDARVTCGGRCVDLQTDRENCGSCSNGCGPGKVCAAGACAVICPPEWTDCAGSCVNLAEDRNHCGGCDAAACPPEQVCDGGQCECAPGKEACGQTCVDLAADPDNCGDCNNECPLGHVCADGACQLECPLPQTECFGACFDKLTSVQHCAVCGNECAPAQRCRDGSCRCPDEQELCGSFCVDTNNDRAHCGGCNQGCPAGHVCDGEGRCVPSCQQGFELCDGVCANVRTDEDYCGACDTACGSAQVCRNGTCVCPEARVACGERCVDLQTDRANCGECGNGCESGQVCAAGECEISCPPGWTNCDGSCVDTSTDRDHCGACRAEPCAPEQLCIDDQCRCIEGKQLCGGTCVNIQVDPQHCGGCDAACARAEVCAEGVCQLECPSSQVACLGSCADLQQSAQHCGACGNECAPEERCQGGLCQCPGQRLLCGSACVDPNSDRSHCGACDQACPAGEVCSQGACEVSCQAGLEACGGACVDLTSHPGNCGSCGSRCPDGDSCVESECRAPADPEPRCLTVLPISLNAKDPFPPQAPPSCDVAGGVGTMTYRLPVCGDGSYVACDFAKSINLDGFDADNQAGGVMEIEFCSSARISGELNLWYGMSPTRKKLVLLEPGETMEAGCRVVRRAPEQAICHWTARPEWGGDCAGIDSPSFDRRCRSCGSQCNQGCNISFSSAKLTLVAEQCVLPQPDNVTVELRALRFLPQDCTCTSDQQCEGSPDRTQCQQGLFSSQVCPPGASFCGVCASPEPICPVCGPGEVCQAGVCRSICPAGQTSCDGSCVSLQHDPEHCGACAGRCEPENGVAACLGGSCRLVGCSPGFGDADGVEANGCECRVTNSGVEACDGVDNDCDGITDFELEPDPHSACECFERKLPIDREEADSEGSGFPRCAATSCVLLPSGGLEMSYCLANCDGASPPFARCQFAGPVDLSDFDANFGRDGVLEVVFEVVSDALVGKLHLNYGKHPRRKYVELVSRGETLTPGTYRQYFTPDQVRFSSAAPYCQESCGPCEAAATDPDFQVADADMTLVAEGCASAVDARLRLRSVKIVSRGCGCVSDSDCASEPARSVCYDPGSGAGTCGWPGSSPPGMCGTPDGCEGDVPPNTPCEVTIGATTCSGTFQCHAGQPVCEVTTCP